MSSPIPFDPPDPSELSTLLSGFEVSSLIATGGMGAVYKATQLSLDRYVAIKLLPAELGADPAFRERFHAEARSMARLNHANLIGIYDFGEADGMPYIVMEFVPGKSLHHSSRDKSIEQETAVEIVAGICDGLAHAHAAGLIHRDIKPANILLDPKARPKIGDFGLAAATDINPQEGPVYGTPGYAAPEVFQDPRSIGPPFDLYAVGVILYELLTGQKPEEPASPPSSTGHCDPRLDPIFKKATRRNPALRYQDAAEMARDLRKILPTLKSPKKPGNSRIRTASSSPKNQPLTLKRKTSSDPAPADGKPNLVPLPKESPDTASDGKPKLVPLPKGEKPPASRLKPLPEKPAQSPTLKSSSSPADSGKPAAPPPAPVAVSTGGGNWPIIRNLLIIAILIPIIIFTWGIYQDKQAKQEAEREERIAEKRERDEAEKARAEKERKEAAEQERLAAQKAAEEALAKEKRRELLAIEAAKTPTERLSEFRRALAAGRRDRFPDNTIDRSSHFLYFIETPMTWGEAVTFAEDHGGHLAAPTTRGDLDVLTKRMSDKMERIWLGGGAQGKAGWSWITGEEWTYKDPGTLLGSCASVTANGVIQARAYGEKNPFVIQWSKDGENPGSRAAQFERLAPTLEKPSPNWPPATVAYDSRHYLLVLDPVSWEEADLIAATAGGHLAVPSDLGEAIFLRDYCEDALLPGQSVWLGGRKDDDRWTWNTGEAWDKARWAANSPDGDASANALRFLQDSAGAGWDDSSPEAGECEGFIIEWSSDAERAQPDQDAPAADPVDQFARTRQIARRLVKQEIEEYEKFLAANRDSLLREARTWFRVLAKSEQEAQEQSYLTVVNNLPESGDLSGDLNLDNAPPKLRQLIDKAAQRQARRQGDLNEKLELLRQRYLAKLVALRDQFEKKGLKSQLAPIDAEIESVGQTAESFRAAFEQ